MRGGSRLAIVGLLVILACVGSTVAGPAQRRLELWTWGDERFFKHAFDLLVQRYPEYRNIQWITGKSGDDAQQLQKLLVAYAAKSHLPDLAEVPARALPALAKAGVLLDLTDRMMPYRTNIAPGALQLSTYRGRIYAVPFTLDFGMVFYRRDVFQAVGIDPAQLRSWEDYIAAGKKIVSFRFPDGKKRFMLNIGTSSIDWYFPHYLLTQLHVGLFDPQTGDTLIDRDDRVRMALRMVYRLATEGIAVRMDSWTAPWYAAIRDGVLATLVVGTWMDQILQLQFPDTAGKWGFMHVPAFDRGGDRIPIQVASGVSVISGTSDPELSWKYLETAFLDARNTVLLDKRWFLTPVYLPSHNDPYYTQAVPFYQGQSFKAFHVQMMKKVRYVPSFVPGSDEAFGYLTRELLLAIGGQKSIDRAIEDAANTIRTKIGVSK
jgi:lactose/L-arabinose transport system substrate-binding protein